MTSKQKGVGVKKYPKFADKQYKFADREGGVGGRGRWVG